MAKNEIHHSNIFSEHVVFSFVFPTIEQNQQTCKQTNKQTKATMIIDDQLFGLKFDDIWRIPILW